MKQIFVRTMRDQDLKTLALWAGGNPAWDGRIYSYAGTFTLCAFNGAEVIAFMPVQQPLVMEAIAFHPLCTDSQKALAMKEFTHSLITQAYAVNKGEIYFLGSDEATNKFAEHQGFKKIDWPVYRTVLAELEAGENNGHV
jgi:hypothetical protein